MHNGSATDIVYWSNGNICLTARSTPNHGLDICTEVEAFRHRSVGLGYAKGGYPRQLLVHLVSDKAVLLTSRLQKYERHPETDSGQLMQVDRRVLLG